MPGMGVKIAGINTNTACYNQRKSEDADKWVGRVAAGLLLFAFIGIVSRS
jgi:hypothetical protein